MRFDKFLHSALVVVPCLTLFVPKPSVAQPPTGALATVQLATIEILDVSPKAPTVGQVVTVSYQVTNLGLENKSLSGNITGFFQGKSLVGPGGLSPAVDLQPKETKTGQLTLTTTDAGEGAVTVIFREPLARCLASKVGGASDLCKPSVYATANVQLLVTQPLVQVRIAGQRYAKISRLDSKDGSTVNNGYQCVVHDPGCGSWGNDGVDRFFSENVLPATAKLVGPPQFVQYWPIGINSDDAGGAGINSEGSYYANLNTSDPGGPSVKWNNTCQLYFAGKRLYYSISFIVSMPKGTDLGEETFDPTSQRVSPCLPLGYSDVRQKGPSDSTLASGWAGQVLYCNPTTQSEQLYLHIRAKLLTPNANAQGDGSPMVEDNLLLQFAPGGSVGSQSSFRTAMKYKQGNWEITDAYITTAPTSASNTMVKNVPRIGPFDYMLPGPIGGPVLDFRGGSCL